MTMSLKVLAAALATAAIIVAPASALTAAHGSDLRPWTTTLRAGRRTLRDRRRASPGRSAESHLGARPYGEPQFGFSVAHTTHLHLRVRTPLPRVLTTSTLCVVVVGFPSRVLQARH